MNEQLKKDRETLKGFLATLVILTAAFFMIAVYRSPIPTEVKPFLKALLVGNGLFLLASGGYLYKVCRGCGFSWPLSLAVAILFAVCGYKYGLVTLIIAFFILWRSKKVLVQGR
jgi:hypothetical protein